MYKGLQNWKNLIPDQFKPLGEKDGFFLTSLRAILNEIGPFDVGVYRILLLLLHLKYLNKFLFLYFTVYLCGGSHCERL